MPPSSRPRPASRAGRPAAPRGRSAIVVLAFLLAAVVAVAVVVQRPPVGAEVLASDRSTTPRRPVVTVPRRPGSAPSPSATADPSPTADPITSEPVLTLPGPVPAHGRGGFTHDDRPGRVLGRSGSLRRFRVAVEDGSGEDVHAFGDAVQRALTGPGSWVDGGRLRLQRVPAGSGYDFTVYLATRDTARRLCGRGGIDIRKGGVPYTSCRVPGKVVVNLDRWRLSVPHLVAAGVPLDAYRLYVVNHEVGHQLGHRHERCPGVGRPAPVMQQQTLFLDGCRPNPWPYLDGERYAGPPA